MKKYISTLLIIALLFPFLLPFSVSAAPLNDDLIPGDVLVSSNGVTYYPVGDGKGSYQYVSVDDLTKKLTSSTGNSFKKFGKALLDGFEKGYGTVIYALKPESTYSEYDKDCVALIDKAYNGSASVSDVNEIFTISDNQLSIKDSFQVNINNIVEQASDEIDSNMIVYQTYSPDEAMKFMTVDNPSGQVNAYFAVFNDEDYPLYFTRWNDTLAFCSLSNIQDDSSINVDGLIYDGGYSWELFVKNFSTFQNHGYLNDVDNDGSDAAYFLPYANGHYFQNLSDYKYSGSESELHSPINIRTYDYDFTAWNNDTRSKTAFFSNNGALIPFFKDSQSYLSFWNNKYVVPYDFENSNIDYTDFFNNLDKDALNVADNLTDIYDVLNNAVVEGLQDAVDRLTTTNQWLKKIYNKVDDWKKEWNLRNVFSTLTDIVDAVDDLIDIQNEVARLVNNTITSPVIDNIETMVEDVTLASTLKSRFPFCIPIALVGTVDYISSFEAKPITFSISSNALGVPINFNFEYEDVPGHQIATLIVRSFIFLVFAFGMYRLTLRIIDIGKD